jgi:hypothetical protein
MFKRIPHNMVFIVLGSAIALILPGCGDQEAEQEGLGSTSSTSTGGSAGAAGVGSTVVAGGASGTAGGGAGQGGGGRGGSGGAEQSGSGGAEQSGSGGAEQSGSAGQGGSGGAGQGGSGGAGQGGSGGAGKGGMAGTAQGPSGAAGAGGSGSDGKICPGPCTLGQGCIAIQGSQDYMVCTCSQSGTFGGCKLFGPSGYAASASPPPCEPAATCLLNAGWTDKLGSCTKKIDDCTRHCECGTGNYFTCESDCNAGCPSTPPTAGQACEVFGLQCSYEGATWSCTSSKKTWVAGGPSFFPGGASGMAGGGGEGGSGDAGGAGGGGAGQAGSAGAGQAGSGDAGQAGSGGGGSQG